MTSKPTVDLAAVASELYGLDPESFTAARNARAREVTAAGDRALAGDIKKLGKPTAAAWLANQLARSSASTVDELISLGPELRRAQSGGQRAEMRRLVEQRRALIGELLRGAAAAAGKGGHSFAPSVERQLEETLEAAVADETLGRALREGRLTEPFRFVGFGEAPDPGSGPDHQALERRATPTEKTQRKAKPAAAQADAGRQVEAERRTAREALDKIEASVEKARVRVEAAAERLGRASKLMKEAETEEKAAAAALRTAREGLGPARRRLKKLEASSGGGPKEAVKPRG